MVLALCAHILTYTVCINMLHKYRISYPKVELIPPLCKPGSQNVVVAMLQAMHRYKLYHITELTLNQAPNWSGLHTSHMSTKCATVQYTTVHNYYAPAV